MMPGGRPTDHTPELAEAICERIALGESLRQIERDDDMPSRRTILRWARDHDEFRHQYARAKADQMDVLAEELLEIADDGSNDWQRRELASGAVATVPDHEHLARSRLRIDARKWLMAKLAAKKYGDKADQAVTGNIIVTCIDFANADKAE